MELSKPPFEDGIFISVYRNILLRPINFCDSVDESNIKKCVSKTNKFSQSAIQSAYAIYLSELSPNQLVIDIKRQYNQEKCAYYFYIIYRELFRRNHPSAELFLSLVKTSQLSTLNSNIFKTFNHQLAWDYVLMFLAHEKLSSELFKVLWHRYKKPLLICEISTYIDFIASQYFDKSKATITFNNLADTNSHFDFIIQRAEKFYYNSNIFREGSPNFN